MDDDRLTPNQVEKWLSEADRELAELEERIRPLAEERRRLHERRDLLKGLLASFNGTEKSEAASLVAPASVSAAPRTAEPRPTADAPVFRQRAPRNTSVREYVVRHAAEILRDAGEPLHINDLHARFVERGYTVPGAGKPVNLIVHLRGADETISSPRRGIYALADGDSAGTVRRAATKRTARRRKPGRRG